MVLHQVRLTIGNVGQSNPVRPRTRGMNFDASKFDEGRVPKGILFLDL
jgi:hypothetical protein